jgi:hypothetical protein
MKNSTEQTHSSNYEYFLIVVEIAASLWVHIMTFETTLRNFLHKSLSKAYGEKCWWLVHNLLTKKDGEDIYRVQKRLKKRKKNIPAQLLISNLSLSFWVELLSTRYHETIWLKIVGYFPVDPGRRSEFHRKAREIRNLRNSIAHHGPIMRRNLIRDHEYLHELTATLDPDLADAVQKRSRVLDLLLNARLVGSGGGI